MKSSLFRRWILLLILSFTLATASQARVGGGRSSGFRGSRSFGTRSAPSSGQSQPYRSSVPSGNYANPAPAPAPYNAGGGMMSGGFMRGGFMQGMLGGLAGGMIGSMLFGGLGRAGGLGGMGGGGGTGLLDILVLLGLGYMVFRFIQGRKQLQSGAGDQSHYDRLRSVEPGPYVPPGGVAGGIEGREQSCSETLSRYNLAFNPTTYKDDRMDDFMKLQAAWNFRDLSSLSELIAPELRSQLESDISQLKADHQVNRIDNIAVRSTELIEAWQERGQEFATIRFRANLIDYTIDEISGQIVAGDRLQPVKFEEDWTFVRSIAGSLSSNSWKITAIEA